MSDHITQINYLDPELLQQLGDLELVAHEVDEGLREGSHRGPLRGFSTEFAHHRQYAPGDAIRDIDWRVYGRTDRYYTKLYEAETNFDCHELVISDLLADVGDIMSGFDHLRFDGHNVMVLHTLDPYELAFPFKGTWRFEGLEQEDPLTTQPERIRDDYMTNLNAYLQALRSGGIGANINYKTVDISRPVDGVLNEFFAERSASLTGAAVGARI